MPFTRWQQTVLGLFSEIGMIEPLVRSMLNRMRPAGLNEDRFVILNHLTRIGSPGETRRALRWQMIDHYDCCDEDLALLADSGLIRIDVHGQDPEEDCIFLTDAGREAHKEAVDTLSPEFKELLAGIPVEAIEAAMKTLREIRRTFDNLPER